jgi:ankyrin repeat protein
VLLRLIEQGASVNVANLGNLTPLHISILALRHEVALFLLQNGADPKAPSILGTPTQLAERSGSKRVSDIFKTKLLKSVSVCVSAPHIPKHTLKSLVCRLFKSSHSDPMFSFSFFVTASLFSTPQDILNEFRTFHDDENIPYLLKEWIKFDLDISDESFRLDLKDFLDSLLSSFSSSSQTHSAETLSCLESLTHTRNSTLSPSPSPASELSLPSPLSLSSSSTDEDGFKTPLPLQKSPVIQIDAFEENDSGVILKSTSRSEYIISLSDPVFSDLGTLAKEITMIEVCFHQLAWKESRDQDQMEK